MAKDAVATMGMILTDDVGGRDAVHVAVISAEAGQKLAPGHHVGKKSSDGDKLVVGVVDEPIGIVDPFLEEMVQKGQRFWLYLYPRTITSLRHNWTHPKFEDLPVASYAPPSQKLTSEQWLRAFVARSDCPSYEAVIAAAIGEGARTWSDEYLHFDGSDAHGDIPPEFWDHVEVVTGRKIPQDKRPAYFSCSC